MLISNQSWQDVFKIINIHIASKKGETFIYFIKRRGQLVINACNRTMNLVINTLIDYDLAEDIYGIDYSDMSFFSGTVDISVNETHLNIKTDTGIKYSSPLIGASFEDTINKKEFNNLTDIFINDIDGFFEKLSYLHNTIDTSADHYSSSFFIDEKCMFSTDRLCATYIDVIGDEDNICNNRDNLVIHNTFISALSKVKNLEFNNFYVTNSNTHIGYKFSCGNLSVLFLQPLMSYRFPSALDTKFGVFNSDLEVVFTKESFYPIILKSSKLNIDSDSLQIKINANGHIQFKVLAINAFTYDFEAIDLKSSIPFDEITFIVNLQKFLKSVADLGENIALYTSSSKKNMFKLIDVDNQRMIRYLVLLNA
jgi:hypothetical protein